MRRSHREHVERFEERWGDLARYNAEASRGLLHRPEVVDAMAVKQAQYDEMQRRGLNVWWDPIPDAEAIHSN